MSDLQQRLLEFPIQHLFSEEFSHCFGCGTHNEVGLQIKSRWDGQQAMAKYVPEDKDIGIPNFVYGGLVASLIDCHAIATAGADYVQQIADTQEFPKFVTGTLSVKYTKPTPLSGKPLELLAWVSERNGKKVTVLVELSCDGVVTAEGNVVAFQIPDSMQS